jgi:peptidoglycan/xylan/chitin deacetylase (PgdA/CDA1 family)
MHRYVLIALTVISSLAAAGDLRPDLSSLDDYARREEFDPLVSAALKPDLTSLEDYRTPEEFRIKAELRGEPSPGESAAVWEEINRAVAAGESLVRREPVVWETLADYRPYEKVGQWRLLYDVARADEWADPRRERGERPKVSILMYHDIRDTSKYSTVITPWQFEEEVRWLTEAGYTFITIGQLLDAVYSGGGDLPPRCVAMTFDDGWSGVYRYAYPILKRYGATATLYLYTNYIGVGGRSNTWDQYREMLANGFEIGSHTVSHPDLTNRGAWSGRGSKPPSGQGTYTQRLMHELVDSRLILEEHLGVPIRSLALPYGAYDDYVLKSALLAGYEGILTIKPGNTYVDADTNEIELRRWNVVPSIDLATFIERLDRE